MTEVEVPIAESRICRENRTVVKRAILTVLGVSQGDSLVWYMKGGDVIVRKTIPQIAR